MCHPDRWILLLVVALLPAGCNSRQEDPGDRDPGNGATVAAGESAGGIAGDRAPAGADDPGGDVDRPVCLRNPTFVGDGALPLDATSRADVAEISALRWERHDGCERLVIDLAGPDGAPATAPGQVTAEVRRDLGVVRIALRDVESVDPEATDARFEGPLARAAYAVRSSDGTSLFVDLHLSQPAEAAALLLSEPGRVVVDLRPGGGPVPPPPAADRRVVVLEPRAGNASYPLTVAGYARTFEANVVVRLERSGQVAHEDFTTATAWADAWGHYTVTIRDGPEGPVRLHVGEHSARDGTWEGAVVELEMR